MLCARTPKVKANSRNAAEQFPIFQRPLCRGSTESITSIPGSIFRFYSSGEPTIELTSA